MIHIIHMKDDIAWDPQLLNTAIAIAIALNG
jgi:hypothetical protein